MNCRRFRRELPDWLRGGLDDMTGAAMQTHAAGCRECAREEALERHLRASWKSLPQAPPAPELWPQVAAALESGRRSAPPLWKPARLAVASIFAAGALFAILISNYPGSSPGDRPVGPELVDERKVIQMVTELREIPDLELAREEMRPPEFRHETALLGASLRR